MLYTETQRVERLARSIRKRGYRDLDELRLRERFYFLHNRIVTLMTEMCLDVDEFYGFVELMEDAADIFTPHVAYSYGKWAGTRKADPKKEYDEFLREMSIIIARSDAAKKRASYFGTYTKVREDLGVLIEKIYELHIKLSVVNRGFWEFFMLGYDG